MSIKDFFRRDGGRVPGGFGHEKYSVPIDHLTGDDGPRIPAVPDGPDPDEAPAEEDAPPYDHLLDGEDDDADVADE